MLACFPGAGCHNEGQNILFGLKGWFLMAHVYHCPRGHRWEGNVKGSLANPGTRVICPTCGLLALTPVRPNDPPAPAAAGRLEDTLMEPLSKILERAKVRNPESTAPDIALPPQREEPVQPGATGAGKETPQG